MQIFAKSALDKDLMKIKMNLGADAIEVQLLDELVNGKIGRYNFVEDVFDLSGIESPVRVVHTPLCAIYGFEELNLEDMIDCQDFRLLDQVCYIADYFDKKQGELISVVIHSEMYMQKMTFIGDTWERVTNCIRRLLFKYSNIVILIENLTPIRSTKSHLVLPINFLYDNVEMVRELRKQLDTDRVGTVLDTCHAEITNLFMTKIYDIMYDRECEDYSLDRFFALNKDFIGLIHLSKTVDYGYGKGKHGMPFEDCKKDREFIANILDLYAKYDYSCPITLEVAETDFRISDGFATSNSVLREVLNIRGLEEKDA